MSHMNFKEAIIPIKIKIAVKRPILPCMRPLPREPGDTGQAFLPAGTLDDESNIRPQASIFQDSKASWSCAGDQVHCFSEYAD